MKVFCSLNKKEVGCFDKNLFFLLEEYLIKSGLASDKDEFCVIKERLVNPPVLSPNEFAEEVIYVILASGFRQKIAKQKFFQIMEFIYSGNDVVPEKLLPIFGNVNKINAICKVWKNKEEYSKQFYNCCDVKSKMQYLETLPHIGNITKNHIARNLGINDVKYDVWIQRLGIAIFGEDGLKEGFPLNEKVKAACDKLFSFIEKETSLPRGYIDVVLWKSCQIGLLEFS